MQFHIPSVVQGVPADIALPVPTIPVLAGATELDEGVDDVAAG
jgi:hypothetical protein